MHIGYQGIENSYSHQVCSKFLDMKKLGDDKVKGFKSFEIVFSCLLFGLIDFAILPIENSIGGCIFLNYDLFYKHNIKIHCEFHHNIEHSLYSTNPDFLGIEKIISHPQALQQCKDNLKKNNFEIEEYWDTTASMERLLELKDDNYGCLAPPGLSEKYGLYELKKCFNDQENNITRFYLISLKDKKFDFGNILRKQYNGLNLVSIKNKFSGYVVIKDKIGSLQMYLNKFNEKNINLTKIESRPYLGSDRNKMNTAFSYIFYIEGEYNFRDNKIEKSDDDSYQFNYFGEFFIFDFIDDNRMLENSNINKLNDQNSKDESNENIIFNGKLNIGVVGFGRFGQFISEKMVKYGFNVYATSRSDYTSEANKMNVTFSEFDTFLENHFEILDIIIFATSINSFEKVINHFIESSKDKFKNKIIVDVLSVKEYPNEIFRKSGIDNNNLVLLTHPMFGPDSAKNSWVGKKFVYWYYYKDYSRFDKTVQEKTDHFIKFWENQGCEIICLDSINHDFLSANSQFLSHFIGRMLELFNCEETIIDTDLYSNLLKVKNYACNDSWDLFDGLYNYNNQSKETIRKLKFSLFNLIENLETKKMKESSTGKVFSLIKELKSEGQKLLNLAIGEPKWYPNMDSDFLHQLKKDEISEYSTSKGESKLIDKLIDTYKEKSLIAEINSENVMITSGAKFGLYLILKLLTKPGSKWIIPKPYWVSYPDIIESLEGESIFVDTEVSNNWEPNIDEIWKLNKSDYNYNNIKGIILCNPNNPTGISYSDKFINYLINLVIKKKIYLIVDEVYLMVDGKIKSLYSKINENNDLSKYLVIVSSFSKYYAIPGWRVGYVFTNKDMIKDLCKIQSTISGCCSKASQELAYNLLERNLNPDLSFLGKSKLKIENILEKKGWKFGKSFSSGNQMYIFPYHEDENTVSELEENLLSNNVFVMNGKSFGVENCLRILLPFDEKELKSLSKYL